MEGGSGGEGKATEGHGHPGSGNAPANPPSPLSHPTMGRHNLGTCGGQAQLNGRLARMGDKVRWPQGQPHRQQQAAKMPQQEFGQGTAGTLQECQGRVKRLQERPLARQKWARAAATPQENPQVAREMQEMREVAQPPESKVSGAAKPPLQAAEPL